MADWVLCYARKEKSVAINLDSNEKMEFSGLKGKAEFLSKLTTGDQLFTEVSSGNDKVCLATATLGVEVFRIHTHLLPKNLTRLQRVKLIADYALQNPDKFYPYQETDKNLSQLRILVDAYGAIQKGFRIPVQLRLQGVYQDLPLVGSEKFQVKLREELAPRELMAKALGLEKALVPEIQKLLQKMPVYQAIFQPIKGCGPLISARFIAYIQDINRFSTRGKLKSYAGYGQNADGEIQKRQKGQPANWSQPLKQAVFLFLDQVNRHDPAEDPWKRMLLARKLYERQNFPEPIQIETKNGPKTLYTDGHIHRKALRYVGQKFLEWLWKEWRKFEGLITE